MKVTGHSSVYGIIGNPIDHTLSPAMHNAAYEAMGIDAVYVPFDVQPEDLGKAVFGIRSLSLGGVNVTLPYKNRVIEFLDELDASAKEVGAVNVIVRQKNKLIGHNADRDGFLLSLQKDGRFDPLGKRVVVLGAGGAAAAVASALAGAGVRKLVIANRNKERAEMLIKRVRRYCDRETVAIGLAEKRSLYWLIRESDLLVNATSLGVISKEKLPVPPTVFHEKLFVMDLVYGQTPLLKAAQKQNLKTLDGLGMLVSQGVKSFELMTGKRAPFKVMKQAAEQALKLKK